MRALLGILLLAFPMLGEDQVVLPQTISLRFCGPNSPTRTWAADRIATELRTLHGLRVQSDPLGQTLFDGADRNKAVLLLGRAGDAEMLDAWCREQNVDLAALAAKPESYRVVVRANPGLTVIVAGSDLGLWYGACAWLDALREQPDGTRTMPGGVLSNAPALAYRITRALIPRGSPSCLEEAVTWLDWWARWRLNITIAGSAADPFLPEFLREAHRRGIRVLRGLGVRNVCATDPEAIRRLADEFRRFLQQGGDGVSMLWDDLPHERCSGHCERCRARFGTNSLPHEIVRVLEALCDVAATTSARPLVVWCPPHYSENRYPELSDDDFFRVIGASRKVRAQTHLYHCEFAPEKLAVLDRHRLTNRIWWYNGLRTVYHVAHHWPTPPGVRLAIPEGKAIQAPDFAPFEVGWKTGSGVDADGGLIPVPTRTWQYLRTLPARYQGFYPCTATHPYHAAVGGLFAFDPTGFEQIEADWVVFRAMFGPGSAKVARAWSQAYTGLQIQLVRSRERHAGSNSGSELAARLAAWQALGSEVKTRAAQGRSLLSLGLLESVLTRMTEAEAEMARLGERETGGESSPSRAHPGGGP